ncbi:MAG: tetraacyldisaccharide 4'-kinase [Candidatus Omnitrophota bacterium]|jgi:tetraacyldisaccharide 4'-kinase
MIPSVKLYMLSIMKGERRGFFAFIVKSVMRVFSWFYALAIGIVDWAYRSGLRRVHKIDAPVVSVGNITLGGTGKTPFTIFLARYFSETGKKPAVLIRGYGDDERKMLRDELPDVPVFAGQDRVRNALTALKDKRDIIILDDGFQHRRIDRDLNIVMLDSESLSGGELLFPRGTLREPLASLKRSDVLVLSKIDKVDEERKKEVLRKLKDIVPDKLVVTARHKIVYLNDVTGAVYSVEGLTGQNVCLVSGIADPDYFAHCVGQLGAVIASRYDYVDHYDYRQKDIDRITADVRSKKLERVITTKKDYVKMRRLDLSRLEDKLFIMDMEMDIVEGKEDLIGRLNSVISGKSAQ